MSQHYSFIFIIIWFPNVQISKKNAYNMNTCETRGSGSLYCNLEAIASSEACFLEEILQLQTLFWQNILTTATNSYLNIIG